jgi:pyruvate dehydrogenase E2 component (dihydrolipoamide acetyltransferase)
MSHEIRVPRLGWSMEEGTFVRWLKQPGEAVRVGEPLFELEGDKATQAVESLDAGTLHVPSDAPNPGAVVAVGTLLGYLLAAGETVARSTMSASTPLSTAHAGSERRSAPPASKPSTAARPIASPRARRIAKELGMDLTCLPGSGRDGRIRAEDVTAAAKTGAATAVTPLSRRRTIAQRLRRSQEHTVPVTLTTTLDATNLVALRDGYKSAKSTVTPAYTDIIACVVARVLAQHPHLAARWDGAELIGAQATDAGFDIGIAVHTDAGLLVPVLRGLGRKPLPQVAEESRLLIERARAGKLTAPQMQGGVFTITSLGAYGIDAFTPVLNYPEIAILGVGAIRPEAVVLSDGRVAARQRLTLSLTFDHAALDGVPAAAFLRELAAALTAPALHAE